MMSTFYNKIQNLLRESERHAWRGTDENIIVYRFEIPKSVIKPNIVDCLLAYTREEELVEHALYNGWKKRIVVVPPSEIFIIQLKRFEIDIATKLPSKNKTFVTIPETIDSGVLHKGAERKGGIRKFYNIYAIVCHHGKSKNNGHYTAYAKTQDGTWSHFDDSVVTPMGSFNDVPIKDAYILFYELQK
eukprot:300998_1